MQSWSFAITETHKRKHISLFSYPADEKRNDRQQTGSQIWTGDTVVHGWCLKLVRLFFISLKSFVC